MTNPQTEFTQDEIEIKKEVVDTIIYCEKHGFDIKEIIGSLGIGIYRQGIIKAADTAREDERNYYQERYAFNRDEAFSNFCKMLTGVLIHKTSPGLIQAIVEDVTTEYRKIYYPEAIQQDTKE